MRWYRANARDLPWRGADPWSVVVSEFMLQQTPVNRVLPVYEQWLKRWPTARALANTPASEVLRAWGRLGYPRRAQRLHQLASTLVNEYDGEVPSDIDILRTLPGIGEYTASAIMAFAFEESSVVLDTNIRRVLARSQSGEQWPSVSITHGERELAASLVPQRDAHVYNAAIMELGAVVCTAARPKCDQCPIQKQCAWLATGQPQSPRPHRTQTWHGTDRQCRGAILQMLRDATSGVSKNQLSQCWHSTRQFESCLAALIEEGFVEKRQRVYVLAD